MAKRMSAWERKQAEQRHVAELECENWNLKHPVGTAVTLKMDSGETRKTKTRSEAFVSHSGHAVCFFEGVLGYYLLNRALAETVTEGVS